MPGTFTLAVGKVSGDNVNYDQYGTLTYVVTGSTTTDVPAVQANAKDCYDNAFDPWKESLL